METFCFIYFWAIYCLKCKHDAYEQISQIFGKLVTHTCIDVDNKFATNKHHNGIYINFKTMSSISQKGISMWECCVWDVTGNSAIKDFYWFFSKLKRSKIRSNHSFNWTGHRHSYMNSRGRLRFRGLWCESLMIHAKMRNCYTFYFRIKGS